MFSDQSSERVKAEEYATKNRLTIKGPLGFGNDGVVWGTLQGTAIKVLERRASYYREKDAYIRLHEHNLREICGCVIPQLSGFDDTNLIIEMTVVFPPFIIDFAKAYVDTPPDFSAQTLSDWHEQCEELFWRGLGPCAGNPKEP